MPSSIDTFLATRLWDFSCVGEWQAIVDFQVALGEDGLVAAKNAFRQWWANGVTWPANKNQDPLRGTDVTVEEGPP